MASNSDGIVRSESIPYPLAPPQIRWLLARFITQARSIPADARVLSRDFLDAYHYASGAALVALNEYARDAAPYARMLAQERNEIEVAHVVADGDSHFVVGWTETRYVGDTPVSVEHWRALLDVGARAANDPEGSGNPFDLYVRNLVWSRED